MPNPAYNIKTALDAFGIELAIDLQTGRLINDSRQVSTGDVFCAVIGSQGDGRKFIDQAILSGASLVLAQCHHKQQHGNTITRKLTDDSGCDIAIEIVQFYQLDELLFEFASQYYAEPLSHLKVVGVTGTNGKTSTTQFVASMLETLGSSTAVIGTTGAGKINNLTPLNNTTPGATELNHLLAGFVEQNIENVAMEVSSHALEQGRISAKHIDVAVFTNLSRDHLDYHQTMEAYAEAKFGLFSQCANQVAVINGDDGYGQQWLETLTQPTIVFGKTEVVKAAKRFVYASSIALTNQGVNFDVETESASASVSCSLLGEFNVDNLLAAIGALLALGYPLDAIVPTVTDVLPSIGRMESFIAKGKALAVVDYAHTPDALENALNSCRKHCEGELWVVFGCGGDRDKGKRAQMGEAAERFADHVVITNDNPRSEAPELIANDILSGCEHPERITVMLDRKQAVASTLAHAKPNDIVLLAGKGHENTITIGTNVIEYSERGLVQSIYQTGERA
ncbi:UDP-N-acetylmuramoyl-L-alanyl-D-glutamate--2,6-diaminopimelate ligase [Thalassotalea euphylliae]|uniref:UDP-N-acetylmuramoyl-L-alanyl-D-glutamate--2, 6-diaminopimelate ligase n=1 Tax=Thalassotalea euphylliae TaxID=1655234 RepID=UPI00363C252D